MEKAIVRLIDRVTQLENDARNILASLKCTNENHAILKDRLAALDRRERATNAGVLHLCQGLPQAVRVAIEKS